jgi:hypothetical protein
MKHERDLFVASTMPNAPLAMPKQTLERSRSLIAVLRSAFSALPWI